MEGAMKDERFKHIRRDPRFRRIPQNVSKIKVDKRFKNMFKEKQFNQKSKLDERGRSLNLTSNENLKNLYNVTDSSEESENDDRVEKKEESSVTKKTKTFSNDKKSPKKDIRFKVKIEAEDLETFSDDKKSPKKDIRFKVNTEAEDFDTFSNDKKSHPKKDKVKSKSQTDESSEDSDDAEQQRLTGNESKKIAKKEISVSNKELGSEYKDSSDEDSSDSSDEEEPDSVSSSSDSESSDSSEETNDTEFDHRWEELQADAPDTDEISNRLAVCNMDWDRIRAEDLYAVFDSFKPPDSSILSVKIYPSEYGLKRMEEEKLKGPAELVEETLPPGSVEVEEKKISWYHREKLRQYQMNRLRYYYGVVECDTPETANTLYEQLNGMEYESSSVRFDLRFIPDGVTFDQEPKSSADKIANQGEYTPRVFVTSALQQVKVNLTWDETDPARKETLAKAFTDPETIEKDIREYLASSSDETDDENEEKDETVVSGSTKDRIAKYKALLQSLEETEKKNEEEFEMEVTWNPDLKEKTEQIVKEKAEETSNPFEEKLKKMKESKKLKKQQKKAEQNVKSGSGSESEDSDSDLTERKHKTDTNEMDELYLLADSKKPLEKSGEKKKWKKPKKPKRVDEFKLDVADPRFSAIYTSHEYNIDPSNPHFKQTEGTLAIISEKQKRLQTDYPHAKRTKK